MIIDMPNIDFKDEDWICILKHYLNSWTEIPLTDYGEYNLEKLKFYDGFIGFLMKETEKYLNDSDYSQYINIKFIESWKYQGKLYRIIHGNLVEDYEAEDGYSCKLPQVNYHGMIAHWTDDYKFEGIINKLDIDEPYIILEADTKGHIGFDINKFRKSYNCKKITTEKEREVIFPMYKDCTKERKMTIKEFIQLKEQKNNFGI